VTDYGRVVSLSKGATRERERERKREREGERERRREGLLIIFLQFIMIL